MSSKLILMPTSSWFTSRPIDICQTNGLVASSAINKVIVTANLFGTYLHTIKDAHTKRANALAFHAGTLNGEKLSMLATCSEDLDIKVWNGHTGLLLAQHKLHQNAPTCIDWLGANEVDNMLISCDVKGNIYKWNMNTNEHTRYFPENKPITQVKANPNTYLVAVGYKQGTIVVINVSNEQSRTVYKLKNHEDSVNLLHWFPSSSVLSKIEVVDDDGDNNENKKRLLQRLKSNLKVDDLTMVLCSSSDDRTVRLWSLTDGTQLRCIQAPANSTNETSATGNKASFTAANKIKFTPLCWPTAQYLVSSSFRGELCVYDLTADVGANPIKWQPMRTLAPEKAHKKIIYDISSYGNKLITSSLDRLINTWNIDTMKQEMSMTTLNGFVYSLATSPTDPNIIAASVGDCSIKVINQKQLNAEKYAKSFCNNIRFEVTQISWHPTKESLMAFGTKDGTIGIADVMSPNKPAHYIFTGYNQSVYTLLWCEPLLPDDSASSKRHNFHLYSVSDGKIMQHHTATSNLSSSNVTAEAIKSSNFYTEIRKFIITSDSTGFAEKTTNEHEAQVATSSDDDWRAKPTNQRNPYENGLTEFAVLKIDKPVSSSGKATANDYYFAIGKFDGSIEFYQTDMCHKRIVKLCSYLNHQKIVTCLKWNVTSVGVQDDSAAVDYSRATLLASGSNDTAIHVIDFNKLVAESGKDLNYFFKFKHKLVGHKERITGLNWSLQSGVNFLLSSSFDSTCQVWNADEGTPVANYRGHSDKVLCCMFSLVDANVAYSGGEDYCLHAWKIDAQSFKTPPEEYCAPPNKKKSKATAKKAPTKSQEAVDSLDWSAKAADTSEYVAGDVVPESRADDTNDVKEREVERGSSPPPPGEAEEKLAQKTTAAQPVKSMVAKKAASLTSTHPRELKTIFLVSASSGNKSQKRYIKDCLSLFEVLYEKDEHNKSIMERHIRCPDDQPPLLSVDVKRRMFEFDKCSLSFSALEEDRGGEHLNLYVFGNRLSTWKMTELEQTELKRINYEHHWIYEVWRGNLGKLIEASLLDRECLSDLLVNLFHIATTSTSSSHSAAAAETGKQVLNKLVSQLVSKHNASLEEINRAAMYLLAAHDTQRAIQVYMSKNMYAYALCIGQLRLAPRSPLLYEILEKYASYAIYAGDYETAIMCYLRLADFENAFKILSRRSAKNDLELDALIKTLSAKLALLLPGQISS